jgi:hypothetical protein
MDSQKLPPTLEQSLRNVAWHMKRIADSLGEIKDMMRQESSDRLPLKPDRRTDFYKNKSTQNERQIPTDYHGDVTPF